MLKTYTRKRVKSEKKTSENRRENKLKQRRKRLNTEKKQVKTAKKTSENREEN